MEKKKCGVLYIAAGNKALEDAIGSLKSLKQHCPDLSAALMHEKEVEGFDSFYLIQPSTVHNRLVKLENMYLSPYEYTLYLDNDTKINHSIWEMFEILDRFDIGAVQDFSRKRKLWKDSIPDYAKIPYSFPEYGGGVLLFKKSPEVKSFFNLWQELFYIYRAPLDQPSLRVALWKSDLKIHALPVEYNVRDCCNRQKWDERKKTGVEDEDHLKARILHWRGIHDPERKITPYSY